jgi:hypothetical protein
MPKMGMARVATGALTLEQPKSGAYFKLPMRREHRGRAAIYGRVADRNNQTPFRARGSGGTKAVYYALNIRSSTIPENPQHTRKPNVRTSQTRRCRPGSIPHK